MTYTRQEISNEELKALTNAVFQRYGIDFTNYETKSLKRGFARLMMKNDMDSLLELWSKILKDRAFFTKCIDDLTVNLTELFRNPEIWLMLRETVLPPMRKEKLKIWHAGCSSGEEVYTMSILLHSLGMLENCYIIGTDLNQKMVEQARSGTFSNSLWEKYAKGFNQCLPGQRVNYYFEQGEKEVTLKPSVNKTLNFKVQNLVHEGMPNTYDIIFCRNVMIYFDDTLKLLVLNKMHKHLKPGGLLIIGYYDMFPSGVAELFEVVDSKTRIYKRI